MRTPSPRHLVLAGAVVLSAVIPASAVAADSVFWSNNGANKISYAALDGSGGQDLATTGATVSSPYGTAIDAAGGRVYWSNSSPDRISYAALDGSGGHDLSTTGATLNQPGGVALDPAAGRVYWANRSGNKISYARLDGSGGGDLPTGAATVFQPESVAVDSGRGRIYWANFNSGVGKISYAALDGSGGSDLTIAGATVASPTGIAVDPAAERIYWANYAGNKISQARLDGSDGSDLDTTGATVSFPVGVALDHATGRIIWANLFPVPKISSARADGTGGGTDLTTTGASLAVPTYPVLLRAPSAARAPVVVGTGRVGATLSCSDGVWAGDLAGGFYARAPRTFAHRWTRGGTTVPGATSRTLVADRAGDYRCEVTAANHAGGTPQASAPLTVIAAPAISGFKLSPGSVVRGRRARFTFRLTAAARARIIIDRRAAGQRRGRRCVKPRRGRRARRCSRYVRVRTLRATARAGSSIVALRTRSLAPGRYRATLTAANAAGTRQRTTTFVIKHKQTRKAGRR